MNMIFLLILAVFTLLSSWLKRCISSFPCSVLPSAEAIVEILSGMAFKVGTPVTLITRTPFFQFVIMPLMV